MEFRSTADGQLVVKPTKTDITRLRNARHVLLPLLNCEGPWQKDAAAAFDRLSLVLSHLGFQQAGCPPTERDKAMGANNVD